LKTIRDSFFCGLSNFLNMNLIVYFGAPLFCFIILIGLYFLFDLLSVRWSYLYVEKLTVGERAEWLSRCVSSCHAIFCVSGSFYCLLKDEHCSKDFFFGYSLTCENILTVTLVYWIVDLLFILRYWKQLGDLGIMAHHAFGIVPFAIGRWYRSMHPFGSWILITELSTPFVNNVWFLSIFSKYLKESPKNNGDLMDHPSMTNGKFVLENGVDYNGKQGKDRRSSSATTPFTWDLKKWMLINGFALWITFLLCRVINLPLLLLYMYRNSSKTLQTPPMLYVTMVIGSVSILLLSFFWFIKITRGLHKKIRDFQLEKQHVS